MSLLAPTLQAWFTERLITQRNSSPHTVASYRDTFRLLLAFAAERTGKPPCQLDIDDLDAPLIGAFLNYLEAGRGNSARTRNNRLAAIHALYRFAALRHPEHLQTIGRVIAIPFKRHERHDVSYLNLDEIKALLAAPDSSTWLGRRDHAILLTAVLTGVRVTELITLRIDDVSLSTGAHASVTGKGRKKRTVTLTRETVAILRQWLKERQGQPDDPLFPTRRGAQLSRDAVERLVTKHATAAARDCRSLKNKRVTPWFASDLAIELPLFFMPILGGCPGPDSGGRDDGERQAAQAPAAVAGGEVGGVPRGLLAAALAGGRSSEVGRRRVDGDSDQAVGEGRGAGRVCGRQAGQVALSGAGRVGGRVGGERSALGGAQGAGGRVELAPGKATLGLFGPVPRRVSAQTKLELVGLIDGAVSAGWAHARACRVLEIEDVRMHRWRARLAETGSLEDRPPVGNRVHRILDWEEQAILDLIEEWGVVDRSHRKLAHRGSYVGTVFVSPSTLLRVALKNKVTLPGEPIRPRPPKPAFPEICWEKNRIWIWDATHFTRCKRVAYAIVDVVTRYWIGYLLTTEQTHTQVQLLFARALEDQGLLGPDGLPPDHAPEDPPILVAWSDNGSEMKAIDTRQFMALMAIAQHHGRPGTPTDQAHVESFFSHLKGDWPTLTSITDPAALDTELARIRGQYNTVRLHASIGYVTPDDEHHGRGPAIRRARIAGLKRAHAQRINENRRRSK